MKKSYLISAGLALFCALLSPAQSSVPCGVPQPSGPVLQKNDSRAEAQLRQARQSMPVQVLPVVFHVFHSLYNTEPVGTGTNVSHQAIVDFMDFTNVFLRKQNPDTAQIPAPFQPLAADAGFELCLATTDPSGNTMYEAGVDRIVASSSGVPFNGFTQPVTFSQSYAAPFAWDPARYLNIWIMPAYFYGQYSGYALFPDSSGLGGLAVANGNGPGDGIFITYTQVHGQSRLLVHELGHFFGLRHIWGDASCGDDYCGDTPTQAAANSGCPAFPHLTCSNGPDGDMFCNYMDYTSYACQYMFSAGQVARMQTVLALSPRRRELPFSNACNPAPAVAPVAAFGVAPATICPQQTVSYFDNSGYQPVSWNWTFPGGNPSSSTLQNPQVAYASPGVYGATLVVSNSAGSDTVTVSNAVWVSGYDVFPSADNFENMQLTPAHWQLTNNPFNQPPASWQIANVSAFGSGQYSIGMFIWNQHPIRSYQLDFSGYSSPTLSFDYASARDPQYQPDYADWIDVQVSTDCGLNYTTVLHLDSAAVNSAPPAVSFVPAPQQWRHAVANLWTYAGAPSVYVQVTGRVIPNYLYIDNLNLYDQGIMSTAGIAGGSPLLLLHPNPSAGETRVQLAAADAGSRVELFDVTGRSMGCFTAPGTDFVLERELGGPLSPGVYWVRLTGASGTGCRMLIVR